MAESLDAGIVSPSPAPVNPLSLLAHIWVRPSRALRAVAIGPAWVWVIPLLLALVMSAAQAFAALPAREAAQRIRIQATSEETAFYMGPQAVSEPQEPSRILTLWLPLATAAAGIVFGWLVRAAVLHVSCLALGGQQSFGTIYRTSAWAAFPLILRWGVQALYAFVGGTVSGEGLSGLLVQSGTASGQPELTIPGILLARIDLYAFWYLILLGLAVAAASKLSRGKTLTVIIIYAGLALLVGLGQLLTRGLFGGA